MTKRKKQVDLTLKVIKGKVMFKQTKKQRKSFIDSLLVSKKKRIKN